MPLTPPDVVAPQTLPGWLSQLAERYGDAEALVEPAGEVRTFGELGRRVTALSETLAEAGVRRGGRVAYLLPNSALVIEQFLAATRLGAVSLGINTRSRVHDLRAVLGRARPGHLIAARSFLSIDFQAMISEALDGLEHPPAVGSAELVALSEQDVHGKGRGNDPIQRLPVERRQGVSHIHDQDQSHERCAFGEIPGEKPLPMVAHACRHLGIAVSRKVREQRTRAQAKEIDMPRAPRGLACEGQPSALRKRVDRRRLAGVGTTCKCDLRRPAGR